MRTKKGNHWLYISPALFLLGVYLVYPTVETIYLSFFGRRSVQYVGLQNYIEIFTQGNSLIALRNNLLWFIIFTTVTVSLGLFLAVLFDRLRYESLAKSAIFLPMAISFVGAGVIWKFVYAYVPSIYPQIGILNAIRAALGWGPIAWFTESPWINNLALIGIGIWAWTGFCMVILSAAYKGIDREMIDAAHIDGASEWQAFWYVVLPTLRSTIAVVSTTIVIAAFKVFDIVYVTTNGNYGTEVLANRMYKEMFNFYNFGIASAIAVILLLAVLPFIVINVRKFLVQEEVR